jgi:tRNA threonylcarbamoyladenosine biosynthesis protein TsaE
MQLELCVATSAAMRALGARLAALLRPGDLVVLTGPLGAGKTTLVQGIGAGLGVRGPVTSPTFVIARTHPSLHDGPALVHADAYRLGSRAEVDDLDLDADLDRSVTVVEWGEGLVEDLAASVLEITITVAYPPAGQETAGHTPGTGDTPETPDTAGTGDELRKVRLAGRGDRWQAVAESARQALVRGTSPGWPA